MVTVVSEYSLSNNIYFAYQHLFEDERIPDPEIEYQSLLVEDTTSFWNRLLMWGY